MGTRHLICVYADSEFKLAQYGQWDGYPAGAGVNVLSFIRKYLNSPAGISTFMQHLSDTYEVTQKELDKWYVDAGHDGKSEWISLDVSDKFKDAHPSVQRDMGSGILEYIFLNDHVPIVSGVDFAADSLFCEWAYVINMDIHMLEVFKGFNKSPLPSNERFYFLNGSGCDMYYPVKLVASFSFDELPMDKEFVLLTDPRETEPSEGIN